MNSAYNDEKDTVRLLVSTSWLKNLQDLMRKPTTLSIPIANNNKPAGCWRREEHNTGMLPNVSGSVQLHFQQYRVCCQSRPAHALRKDDPPLFPDSDRHCFKNVGVGHQGAVGTRMLQSNGTILQESGLGSPNLLTVERLCPSTARFEKVSRFTNAYSFALILSPEFCLMYCSTASTPA